MALDVMRIYQTRGWRSRDKGGSTKDNDEDKDDKEVSFAQDKDKKKKDCFKCGAEDYKSCPCDNMKRAREREQANKEKDQTGSNHLNISEEEASDSESESDEEGLSFGHISEETPKNWEVNNPKLREYCSTQEKKDLRSMILIDSGSTVDLFKSKRYLKDIHTAKNRCKIHTNGGTVYATQKGTLQGYGVVWYHPKALTNLLSLNNIKNKYRVQYDSAKEDSFLVHKPDGVRRFVGIADGLYALSDTKQTVEQHEYQFLELVEDNKTRYTRKMIKGAEKAKELYGMVQHPSMSDYKHMVRFGLIKIAL